MEFISSPPTPLRIEGAIAAPYGARTSASTNSAAIGTARQTDHWKLSAPGKRVQSIIDIPTIRAIDAPFVVRHMLAIAAAFASAHATRARIYLGADS